VLLSCRLRSISSDGIVRNKTRASPRARAALAVGRSGDEGIDGVINEDGLGLDVIYLQAKRWEWRTSDLDGLRVPIIMYLGGYEVNLATRHSGRNRG
jgi:restriction endonuclease Mrr